MNQELGRAGDYQTGQRKALNSDIANLRANSVEEFTYMNRVNYRAENIKGFWNFKRYL